MKNPTVKAMTLALTGAALLAATPSGWGVETFNLRAEKFTKTYNLPGGGSRDVEMWGFALGAAAPTAPGPVLTVPPGETALDIVLQNNLTVPISIVIPGQDGFIRDAAHTTFTDTEGRTRASSFVKETPPGGTVTYQWTGLRPGTYLYHSGSHAALQVQMGLYGMLKKDSATGQAYGTAYNNETVLFFSEVDVDVHNAVQAGTYGTTVKSMIHSVPEIYLLNGEPYEGVGTVAFTATETTLVRLLNACYDERMPVVNGYRLSLVAEDGRAYPYPKVENAVNLPALKTRDALVVSAPQTAVAKFFDRRYLSGAGLAVPDTTPPTITSVTAVDASTLSVLYSESVEEVSAETLGNYAINNAVNVLVAVLGVDTRTVTLTTSTLPIGQSILTVNNVTDRATPANTIAANTQVPFIYTPPRITSGLVALYEFTEGTGTTVFDVSGVGTPLDLDFAGNLANIQWVTTPNRGVQITAAGSAIRSPGAASKITQALVNTDQMTVEVWATPAAISQFGQVMTISLDARESVVDVRLRQSGSAAYHLVRTSLGSLASRQTVGNIFTSTTLMRQFVITYNGAEQRLYRNGTLLGTKPRTGTFDNWNQTTWPLVLGNEADLSQSWRGTFHLVAVYDRALSQAEIQQNFNSGLILP